MHKAGSQLVSKEVRGSPSCTPALPLPHPNTSTLMSRVGGEQRMRHQSPYGWREAAKLCPSKPSGRGARLPCPRIHESGRVGSRPRALCISFLPMGVTNMEAEPLPTLTSSISLGSNSSNLHLPDIYCPPQSARRAVSSQTLNERVLSAEP